MTFRNICVVIYPFALWFYTHEVFFELTIARINLICGVTGVVLPHDFEKLLAIALDQYIIAILGICFTWCFVSILSKMFVRCADALAYVGNYTMSIYLAHMIILRLAWGILPTPIIGDMVAVIAAILLLLLLEWSISKY